MLHDRRARGRLPRQISDVAIAAFIQNPIAHSDVLASALFGSCWTSCRLRIAEDPAVAPAPGPPEGSAAAQRGPSVGTSSAIGVFLDKQPQRSSAMNRMLVSLGTVIFMAISIANAYAKDKQS